MAECSVASKFRDSCTIPFNVSPPVARQIPAHPAHGNADFQLSIPQTTLM